MTLRQLTQIIENISISTHFFTHGRMGQGRYLQVHRFVEGVRWGGRKWYLSKHVTESEVVLTALKAVITFEEHEARENFKYKGLAIFHPHPDIDALLEIAGRKVLRNNLPDFVDPRR